VETKNSGPRETYYRRFSFSVGRPLKTLRELPGHIRPLRNSLFSKENRAVYKENVRALFLTAQVPEKRRALVSRAFSGTASPREAIKANCFVCSGMDIDEARNCTVVCCPLYEYNSYRLDHLKAGECDEPGNSEDDSKS